MENVQKHYFSKISNFDDQVQIVAILIEKMLSSIADSFFTGWATREAHM